MVNDAVSGGVSSALPDQCGDQGANAGQGGLQGYGQQVDRGRGSAQLDQGGTHHKRQNGDGNHETPFVGQRKTRRGFLQGGRYLS